MNTITDKLMVFVLGKEIAKSFGYEYNLTKEEEEDEMKRNMVRYPIGYKHNPYKEDFNEVI